MVAHIKGQPLMGRFHAPEPRQDAETAKEPIETNSGVTQGRKTCRVDTEE